MLATLHSVPRVLTVVDNCVFVVAVRFRFRLVGGRAAFAVAERPAVLADTGPAAAPSRLGSAVPAAAPRSFSIKRGTAEISNNNKIKKKIALHFYYGFWMKIPVGLG